MVEMPEAYVGREQTWLKHRVLKLYLEAWAHKVGSFARRLWYIDCFAGPWQSAATDRGDTSIAIGLLALNDAAETWRETAKIELNAVFVEKNAKAFAQLEAFAPEAAGSVRVHTLSGSFGDHVDDIDRLIGSDHAFVFVDPTGWDGAAMAFIARLAAGPGRDVMINVMYDHINRFKDDQRDFLRGQMREFFGLGEAELEPGLSEDQLMRFYRKRLAKVANLPYVADLAVPVPTRDRTKFRLVVGGHHTEVLRLFRDVEKCVVGGEASVVRAAAREREAHAKTGQFTLISPPTPPVDERYAEQSSTAQDQIRARLPKVLKAEGAMPFKDLWPRILQAFHITHGDLKALIWQMASAGLVQIDGVSPKERSLKDHHVVRPPPGV